MKSKKSRIFRSRLCHWPVVNGQGHATFGKSPLEKTRCHFDWLTRRHSTEIDGKRGLVDWLPNVRGYAKEFAADTELTNFDITFDDQYEINLGNLLVIAKGYGSAHSPGDV